MNTFFGMRGWRNDLPNNYGYYIIKIIDSPVIYPQPRYSDYSGEDIGDDYDPNRFAKLEYATLNVIKSYYNPNNQKFDNIPEGFLFWEWLDETPIFLLYEEEISDEFGEEWYVYKRNPFKRDKFLKLLNSCSIEQAKQDKQKRIQQSEEYKREQDNKNKRESNKKFNTPPTDESEY